MGTLTAGTPRLPGYCDHKLPTSCRLSSIPQCCACADERAHSASYSVYIDGIGYVPRGTRWQRYCWFCKEFWENRVTASGLRSGQTRIPTVPDQTEFLERWYDFHRGYRIVRKEDGSEERVAVLGEDFRDVSPGYLPRTIEEMRAGRQAETLAQSALPVASDEPAAAGPSLDETLDQMFEEASLEETPQPVQRLSDAVTVPRRDQAHQDAEPQGRSGDLQPATLPARRTREYQARRIAALRRELQRMRNGIERVISGLRDLGENVPASEGRLASLDQSLNAIENVASSGQSNISRAGAATSQQDRSLAGVQSRAAEAREQLEEARRTRAQAASELEAADRELRTTEQRFQQLHREQRTMENNLRLFGTREAMEAAGENYESPIGGMFTRAMERFRTAEETRQEQRVLRQVLLDEARSGGEEEARRLMELEAAERDVWGVPRLPSLQPAQRPQTSGQDSPEARGELEEYYAMLRRQDGSQQAPRSQTLGLSAAQDQPTDGQDIAMTDPGAGTSDVNFPRNMLNSVVAARERETAERDFELRESASIAPEEEWRRDVEHILLHLSTDAEMRESQLLEPEDITRLLARLMHNSLSHDDRSEVDSLLITPSVVWGSGVITARFMRRRRASQFFTFVQEPDDAMLGFRLRSENIECMAEAFQMSAEVRRAASQLSAAQRLHMLYRLQAGTRREDDIATLTEMVNEQETLELAKRIHIQSFINADSSSLADTARRSTLQEQRQQLARQGNHTREELDAQRRATHDFAVAAGRTAMQTSPRVLLERMVERDDETRAAYQRLRDNGFDPDSLETAVETDRLIRYTVYSPTSISQVPRRSNEEETPAEAEEEDEDQGLDAKDTGRPEPKIDEEMLFKMECRICYTQVAEIACLPCGHLVMCKWCSEQHSPVLAHDRTRPRRAAGCPVCRKGIRQKVRVFRA